MSEKQRQLADAKELHEDYLENHEDDDDAEDFVSNMGFRAHCQKLAAALGRPDWYEHCVLVTQGRTQVGLKPLDPVELLFSGKIVQAAKDAEDDIVDQIEENKKEAEREAIKKKRAASGGGIRERRTKRAG